MGETAHEACEQLNRIVWQWIIDANNGVGGDVDDLLTEVTGAGFRCPADMEEE